MNSSGKITKEKEKLDVRKTQHSKIERKKSQQKRKFMPTKAGCCGTGRKEGDDESGEKDLKCEKQLLGTVTPGQREMIVEGVFHRAEGLCSIMSLLQPY